MTIGTLDDGYFEWLYRQIGSVKNRNPERSYWHLAKQLYTLEFEYFVSNDDNRAADGLELRYEWVESGHVEQADEAWLSLPCSFLEMLIALARRVAFESQGTVGDWFWTLMGNIDLRKYTDSKWNMSIERIVNHTVQRVIYRKYSAAGSGGLFPLKHPRMDQRGIELWYQMSEYVMENGCIDHGPPM